MKIFSFLRAIKIDFVESKKLRFTLLLLMFISYVVIFTSISFIQFDSFSYHDVDLTAVVQYLHSTLSLRFFPICYGDFAIFTGGHLPPFFILLSPVYALFPFTQTILFLQTLFLGAGIFAIYLIARELLSPRWALYFAFAYLLYPALNYVNLFEAHFIAFSVPFLLFMFYFFLKKKFYPFLVCMILSLFCQEDVGLVLLGFGVYVLLLSLRRKEKDSFMWGGIPFISGLAWLIFVLSFALVINRTAAPYKGVEVTGNIISKTPLVFYGWLGQTPLEILKTICLRPLYVIGHIATLHKLRYIGGLLAPLAFFPLAYPEGLFIVACGMLESLISLIPTHSSIYFQYSSILIPFIFISAVYGLRRILKIGWFGRRKRIVLNLLYAVSVISALSFGPFRNLPSWIGQMQVERYSSETALKNYLVNRIPKDAPVIATFELASHLTGRDLLSPFYVFTFKPLIKFVPQVEAHYTDACIDFNDPLTFYAPFYNMPGGLKERCFIFRDGWGLVETIGSIAVFRKGYSSDYRLSQSLGFIAPKEKDKIGLKSDAAVLQYTSLRIRVGPFSVLDVSADIVKLKDGDQDFLAMAEVVNTEGEVFRSVLIAPFRIYHFLEWKQDEVVRIRSKVLLPASFDNKDIKVSILLLPLH
jgi:uncharacterized membrane protein